RAILFELLCVYTLSSSLFFFTDPSPTEIYTLSLHDALPILCATWHSSRSRSVPPWQGDHMANYFVFGAIGQCPQCADHRFSGPRSEEHTSELQSRENLVCRLLLEKKKNNKQTKNNANTICNT